MYDELNIGGLLKSARLHLQYKYKYVAQETGLNYSTIKCYEQDSVKYKLKNLLKLCKCYSINPKELGIKKENIMTRIDFETILIATYSYNNQVVDEIEYNKSRMFVNRGEYIAKPSHTKEENIIKYLYKNRVWDRHFGMGFNTKDIINIGEYAKIIKQECYYCGKKNDQCEARNDLFFYHNGLDRLDNSKGYVKGNVVSCCTKCNMAKGSLTAEEFLNLIDDIYINQKIKNSQK